MGVGYSDLDDLRKSYQAIKVNRLLDDVRDDGLPDDEIFDAVNIDVGIIIRKKLYRRYGDNFTEWESIVPEQVGEISDKILMYQLYVRKSHKVPVDISKAYKEAMQSLMDIANGKEDLYDVTLAEDDSVIWATEREAGMTLDQTDVNTGALIKKGSLHYF
jgi:phage gp36-like protein